jgi:methionine biosynthesis protein MetW
MPDLCSQVLSTVYAEIEQQLRSIDHRGGRLLDVGCWDGANTLRYASAVQAQPLGIEVFSDMAGRARSRGVEVAEIDLEREAFPWPDNSIDVVVCNQVLEHLKNIWFPVSEMFRVVRPNGILIVSVPNLASLHNRVLLFLGRQPTSIRVNGPHVRGFTFREFRSFLAAGFEVDRMLSTGFHPFPPAWTKPLCRMFPSCGHSTIAICRKVSSANKWWEMSMERMTELQTHY